MLSRQRRHHGENRGAQRAENRIERLSFHRPLLRLARQIGKGSLSGERSAWFPILPKNCANCLMSGHSVASRSGGANKHLEKLREFAIAGVARPLLVEDRKS